MAASEGELRELMGGQLAIWYAQQLAPDHQGFNIAEYLEIHGELDLELLVEASRRLLDEVSAYRLRVREVEGAPRQYVHDSRDYPVQIIDVSTAADPRAAAEE